MSLLSSLLGLVFGIVLIGVIQGKGIEPTGLFMVPNGWWLPAGPWQETSQGVLDSGKSWRLVLKPGSGVLPHGPNVHTENPLLQAEFGDCRLHVGWLIQNGGVAAPTIASAFGDEKPKGPLSLQGDRGPIAYRNVIQPLDELPRNQY